MISQSRLSLLTLAILFLILLALTACGGGASSEGGIGGSGISQGIVENQDQTSGKSNVTLNGVQFDTTNSSFTDEGSSTTQASLQEGMVVTVSGRINSDGVSGVANTVAYADIIEGPIQSKSTSSMVVMGQNVIVDQLTKYSGTGVNGFNDLNTGDVIEVSGFYTSQNDIYATYVERTGSAQHEIKGVITAIDNVNLNNFNIRNLQINVTSTAGLSVGDFVKAEGIFDTASAQLNATSVNALNRNLPVSDADDAEIEGLVSSVCDNNMTAPCQFQLGFLTVQVTTNTDFDGGTLAGIQPGIRIEVEGSLNNNIIIAEEIEFEDSIELTTRVVSVDTTASTVTLEFGTTDITVNIDSLLTQFEGTYTNINSIQSGHHVEIRARKAGSDIIALLIKDDDQTSTKLQLQGPVDSKNNPFLTILGVTVDTNTITQFEDANEMSVSRNVFFSLIQPNSIVKLEGTINQTGTTLSWDKAEIED